jgi:ABC-2 type transport system permease protein
MPVYEQGYRRYEARGPLRRVRSWPIMREALRLILVKRLFLGLLALAWIPFLGFVIALWALAKIPEAAKVLPVGGAFFASFFRWQELFILLVAVFAGAGLVANDLRTGAIVVYLSRPLTRRDYVLGKLGVLLALVLAVSLAPALLLYGISLVLSPEHFLKWSLAWLGPAVVLHSLVLGFTLSLLMLAVSSLTRSARVAGLVFVGLAVSLWLVEAIVSAIYRWPAVGLLSILGDLRAVAVALLGGAATPPPLHWAWPALVLGALAVTCLLILRARVRAVEIVQ